MKQTFLLAPILLSLGTHALAQPKPTITLILYEDLNPLEHDG